MEIDNSPVPTSPAQWPEARSFSRMYNGNPLFQSRFVMALFGFRQELLEWANDMETVEAIDAVILAFHERYPQFMQDGYEPRGDFDTGTYHLDERLQSSMTQLGSTATEHSSEQ